MTVGLCPSTESKECVGVFMIKVTADSLSDKVLVPINEIQPATSRLHVQFAQNSGVPLE